MLDKASATRPLSSSAFVWPITIYALLHAGLIAHNLAVPDAIVRGDRAGQRLELISSFLETPGELGQLVLTTGWPGDWLAHGLVWLAGGPLLVLLVQVGLGAIAIAAAIGISRALGAEPVAAATAGTLAVVMPGGIMNPHQLVTESWYTAAFAMGLWAFAEAVRRERAGLVIGGMLLMAAAALIRPQGMILPPIALGALWLAAPHARAAALVGALAALAIAPGLWLSWRFLHTGEFGFGPSNFDLWLNLRIRAEHAMPGLDIGGLRISLAEFLSFALQHPVAILRTYLTDVFNFTLNPGANHVFGHYLNVVATPEDVHYWRLAINENGVGGFFDALRAQKGLLGALLFMGVIHTAALLGAGFGVWRLITRGACLVQRSSFVVLVLALGQLGSTFASGIVRWSHRSPLEPVIAALAGLGLLWLYTALRDQHVARLRFKSIDQ